MQTILITGSNGLVAQSLVPILKKKYKLKFLTRNPKKENEYFWDINKGIIDEKSLENVEIILHLAGASIGEKRWTKVRKKEILDSRTKSAQLILKKIKEKNIRLKTFLSASAVGYYGTITTENIFDENSPCGNDFLSQVCQKWEQTADDFSTIADRILKLRFGVILSPKSGALKKMILPTKYNLNSPIGNGKQIIPWIDIDDLIRFIDFCLENQNISGTYNAVSPNPVSNQLFTQTLAKVLNKKILLPNLPQWIIKLLFGEMSILLLEGSKISAEKILNTGFKFQYPDLEKSLSKMLKEKN